jgi:NTE family protein
MSARKAIVAKPVKLDSRPPFECIALLLQGGGALGAYQGGVYQALMESGIEPDWVAGISIGAVNSAIIAGNPPEKSVRRLREFWESITPHSPWDMFGDNLGGFFGGDASRGALNHLSASSVLMQGVHGFFSPRMPMPWFSESGSAGATSYYDTSAFKSTLEKFVDFDRINTDKKRLSVGAVNVRSGNFVYFDTTTHDITPEHIMASGALPPGFPGIEIEGEIYWDGGLVSNTPLQWVLQNKVRKDTLAFQVDLWNARGDVPRKMSEVMTRQKEIMYSSRTRAATDQFKKAQKMRHSISQLLSKLPKELQNTPETRAIAEYATQKVYNIIHLIYHARAYEHDSKDYDFSRKTMEDHWKSGHSDTVRSLRHPEVLERPSNHEGVFTFDVKNEGRE